MVCWLHRVSSHYASAPVVVLGRLLMAIQLRPPDVSAFKARTTFEDGFGVRVCAFDNANGQLLETLCLRPALTAAPSFGFALRERTATLASFQHESYSHVR